VIKALQAIQWYCDVLVMGAISAKESVTVLLGSSRASVYEPNLG